MELILGAATGVIFGILLQKAEVLRFEKQVGFLLFRDATILKFMLTAILVGAVGIHFCVTQGLVELKIKAATLVPVVAGGLMFGVGWAIGGFCPGTAVGAVGEGRIHALWTVLGMLTGAGLFAEVHPYLTDKYMKMYDFGTVALPELTGMSPWSVIGIMAVVFLLFFAVLESK